MAVLGFILLVLGYWLIPLLLPTIPSILLSLVVGVGWVLFVIGAILFLLSLFGGRTFGGRRYWY